LGLSRFVEAPSNYTGVRIACDIPAASLSEDDFSAILTGGTYTHSFTRVPLPLAAAKAMDGSGIQGVFDYEFQELSALGLSLGQDECHILVNPYPPVDFKRPCIQVILRSGAPRQKVGELTLFLGTEFEEVIDQYFYPTGVSGGESGEFVRPAGLLGNSRYGSRGTSIPCHVEVADLGLFFDQFYGSLGTDQYEISPQDCRPYGNRLTRTAALIEAGQPGWGSGVVTARLEFF
jgi:hypothetical protein